MGILGNVLNAIGGKVMQVIDATASPAEVSQEELKKTQDFINDGMKQQEEHGDSVGK